MSPHLTFDRPLSLLSFFDFDSASSYSFEIVYEERLLKGLEPPGRLSTWTNVCAAAACQLYRRNFCRRSVDKTIFDFFFVAKKVKTLRTVFGLKSLLECVGRGSSTDWESARCYLLRQSVLKRQQRRRCFRSTREVFSQPVCTFRSLIFIIIVVAVAVNFCKTLC